MYKIVELTTQEAGFVGGGDSERGSGGIPFCIPPLPGENFNPFPMSDLLRQLGEVGA